MRFKGSKINQIIDTCLETPKAHHLIVTPEGKREDTILYIGLRLKERNIFWQKAPTVDTGFELPNGSIIEVHKNRKGLAGTSFRALQIDSP